MYRDVHEHVQSCLDCQQSKYRPSVIKAPLRPIPVEGIFSRLHIDYCGPLRTSSEGFKHILVVTDSFTKWCEAIPTKTQEATEVAEVLYRDIFTRYGAPQTLVSDRGQCFMARLVRALCTLFDIKKVQTSSFHPQSNSSAERFMSIIAQSIRTYGKLDQKDWPKYLPGIMMAYRATPCTQSTQYSPFFLLFGREMRLPFDIAWVPKENLSHSAQDHLNTILRNLEDAREIATKNIEEAQKRYTKYYDGKTQQPKYEPGDKVWLHNPKVPIGLSKKFHRMWTGPYYITLKGPNYTFQLRACSDNKEVKSLVHSNRLKAFYDPSSRAVQPSGVTAENQQDTPQAGDTQADTAGGGSETANNDQNEDHLTPRGKGKRQWISIDKILACKRQGNKVYYRVKWAETGSTEWVLSGDVSDYAKREFHVQRTASGRKRKRPLGRNKFFDRPE